jgi:carbamoyl-phosphate synthase large subunit
VPFVSKCIGRSLAQVAALVMAGKTLEELGFTKEIIPSYYSVKEAVFPFNKFQGVDPILGPEMKSTGEVMGVGDTFAEAFGKALLGGGTELPTSGRAFISVRDMDKEGAVAVAKRLTEKGFDLVGTEGTAKFLSEHGVKVTKVNKVTEGRPHIVDMMKNGEIDYIINTTSGTQAITDSSLIRRTALQRKVCYTTTLTGAEATSLAIGLTGETKVRRLQDLHLGK